MDGLCRMSTARPSILVDRRSPMCSGSGILGGVAYPRERLTKPWRQLFVRLLLVGILVAAAACSSSPGRTASTTTTRPGVAVTSTTLASCPASPPLDAGGQQVVPVQVPCECPTASMTAAPATDDAQTEGTAAAVRWIQALRPLWRNGLTRVTAFYKIDHVTPDNLSELFAYNVGRYCGAKVLNASYGVELLNPGEPASRTEVDVVVAHFPAGWQVWGSYHP